VQINPSVARRLVEWLGELAEIRRRTNGCPPIGLVEVQQALAEAVAGGGDSRQREPEGLAAAEILGLNRDTEITTAEAAAQLGIPADLVRWHCRRGNLDSRKVGRQHMVTVASIENYKRRKAENNRSP
jgi:hypothetical protein